MTQFKGDVELSARILAKRNEHLIWRDRAMRLKAAIEDFLADVDRQLQECVLAGRMVGISVCLPDWRKVLATSLKSEMQEIEGLIGGMPDESSLERQRGYDLLCLELEHRAQMLDAERRTRAGKRSLRQLVQEILTGAGERGVKSGVIRDSARAVYGSDFHPKTIGMTLNRLAKEGLVRREGRLWFSTSKPVNEEARAIEIDPEDEDAVLAEAARRSYEKYSPPPEAVQLMEAQARLAAMYRKSRR